MPNSGFKSITVRASVYDDMEKIYKDNEGALVRNGILSISGFATILLYEGGKSDRVKEMLK